MLQGFVDVVSSWRFKWKEWRAWLKEYDMVRTKSEQIGSDSSDGDEYARRIQEVRIQHCAGRLSAGDIESAIWRGEVDAAQSSLWD